MRALVAALLLLLLVPARAGAELPETAPLPPGRPKFARSCADAIGPRRAAALVARCREVASDARRACRASLPCAALRAATDHACRAVGPDRPAGCPESGTPPSKEEEEEEEDDD